MTIKELVEKLQQEKKDADEKERIRQENEKKWFKDLVGKYVSINHNGYSFTIFFVDKEISGQMSSFKVFNVYRNNGSMSIQEERRDINKYWLDNPYLVRTFGEKANMKIITEEEYNKVKEIYNTFNKQLKELNI
jgi:hypothetical protein